MDDTELRAYLGTVPVPSFSDLAWVTPPPLASATVAIVTTAGVHRTGDEPFALGDTTFRTFERDARDLVLGHRSPSVDRIGFAADVNVVTPVDRLEELASDGRIGAVAPRHVSFVGSQPDEVAAVRHDTGPRAAALLREDGVDVVVLTPMGPMCTRTACTLAHVLEANGLATVVLASVGQLAARMGPPRSIFCEFPLGRPLGRPDDAALQHEVLGAALALLGEHGGPVLTTWPGAIGASSVPMKCSLPHAVAYGPRALAEVRSMRAAHDEYRRAYGRTSVGLAVPPERIDEAAAAFVRITEGVPWRDAGLPGNPVACALDLRTYFEEAALTLLEGAPEAGAAQEWFYGTTATGATLVEARAHMRDDDAAFPLWYYLVAGTRA